MTSFNLLTLLGRSANFATAQTHATVDRDTRFIKAFRALTIIMLVLAAAVPAWAVYPEEESRDKIKIRMELEPLGENPFGEGWNPYSGALTFSQTDIVLTGNGLPIVLQREHEELGGNKRGEIYYGFGDWGLNVPRITTLVPGYTGGAGPAYNPPTNVWTVSGSSYWARCTQFNGPPLNQVYHPDDWWQGYQLVTPEGGTQDLLKRSSANTLKPINLPANGTTITHFPAVTTQQWMAGCGITTENEGVSGREGFVVVSPNGTKYFLSWMVYRRSSEIQLLTEDSYNWKDRPLTRMMAHLLVRRVEDRFGNWLSYNYTGELLTSITSNDGRSVTIAWRTDLSEPVIEAITAQPSSGVARTWNYSYVGSPILTGVTLPDGSSWQYGLTELANARPRPTGRISCNSAGMTLLLPSNINAVYTGTIKHPSGLVGTFRLQPVRHGRSYVPYACFQTPGTTRDHVSIQNLFDTSSLKSKTIQDGSISQTWEYSYGPANGSWSKDCASGCTSTVETTLTRPDGSRLVYTSSNKFDFTEGKVLAEAVYPSGSTTAIQTTSYGYSTPSAGPYPYPIGATLTANENPEKQSTLSPRVSQVVIQQGDTYSTLTPSASLDVYGRATSTTFQNSIAGQAIFQEATTFFDDTTRWVLGKLKKRVNVGTGDVIEENAFDATGLLQSRFAFGAKVMEYTWHPDGLLKTFSDRLSQTTTLDPYINGVPHTMQFADGRTQQISANAFGEVIGITDERGHTTTYGRDGMGRVQSVTYPTNDVVNWAPTTMSYAILAVAELGRPVGSWRVRSTHGRHRVSTYLDGFFRPVLVEDMDTNTGKVVYTRKGYDDDGRVIFESYPSASSTEAAGIRSSYDTVGRLRTRTTTDGVTIETINYLSGNRKQVIDADDKATIVTYQAFGSPDYENALRIEAMENRTTVYVRDVYGKPLTATQSGSWSGGAASATRTWQYDSLQRLCRMTEPETGVTLLGYDIANQLKWEAKGQTASTCLADAPGGETIFTYDPRGRKLKDDYAGTSDDVTYTYDAAGNLETAVNATANWTYTYNKRNLLESETAYIDGKPFVIDPTYDELGTVSTRTLPSVGAVDYSPDAWGRPTRMAGYATTVQYHPAGVVSSYLLGNGMVYTQTLDNRLRPQEQKTVLGGANFQKFTYAYSRAGDIQTVTETVDTADTATFTYDDLHRVETATGLWGTYTYAYDPLNNLRSRTALNGVGNMSYAYDAARNRLTSVGGAATRSYSYNARGDVDGDGARSFTVNAKGQITAVSGVASYAYDGNGKRIKIMKGGTTEYAIYDRSGALVYVEKGTTKTNYLRVGTQATVELKNENGTVTTTYLHGDWLGSPRKASTASGATVWNETYEPFGKKMNAVPQKIGYTGHADDADTGLTYAQARFYDPIVGRFLSSDPVRLDGDFNLYAYVGNNPINATDPSGREIRLQSHSVAFGMKHAKVTIIPKNQTKYQNDPRFSNRLPDGRVFATLGAGSSSNNLLAPGLLVSAPNRDRDISFTQKGANASDELLSLPAGADEDRKIEELFAADANYNDDLDYDFFPGRRVEVEGNNSNSYASGLLQAVGIKGKRPPNTPGFEISVTKGNFQKGIVEVGEIVTCPSESEGSGC